MESCDRGHHGCIKRTKPGNEHRHFLCFFRIVLVVVLVIVISLFARVFDYDYDDENDDDRKIAPPTRPGTFVALVNPSLMRPCRGHCRCAFLLSLAGRRRYSPRMDKPDQLRELFRMQKALNERIGVRTEGMGDEDKIKWVLNYCRAMSQEIAELTDSVPWKWWAKYQRLDEQNARVEVVDLFHFLISLAQVLGMSADDVFETYARKNEVNFKRQETGYLVKDEHDSKHI